MGRQSALAVPTAGVEAAGGDATGAAAADPDRSGCGGASGTGSRAEPNAGVATAQGLVGEQTPRLGVTELSGGDTAATVLGGRT
jgi:hypothetical protein